jgi:NAD(P)-dependent dehydrogenase (short-subunit alcohol dehydrogenase family)
VTRAALDLEEKDWGQVIDTNLKGVWLAAQSTARHMVRHGIGGSIVNNASIPGSAWRAASAVLSAAFANRTGSFGNSLSRQPAAPVRAGNRSDDFERLASVRPMKEEEA